jgi:hypothetical protein
VHLTPHYGYENTARRRGQENYSVRIFSVKEMAFNILGTIPLLFSIKAEWTVLRTLWQDKNQNGIVLQYC